MRPESNQWPELKWPPKWLTLATGLANAVGAAAVIVFFYLTGGGETLDKQAFYNIGCSILLVGGGVFLGSRWGRQTREFDDLPAEERIGYPYLAETQSNALNTPLITAGVSLVMWTFAGPLIAVIGPLLHGTFELRSAAVDVIGISFIGGPITALIVFFGTETFWRRNIPFYLMGREISSVTGAPRLPVRLRLLLGIFFAAIVPLIILAITAYLGAEEVSQASPGQAQAILSRLTDAIAWLLIGGAVLSGLVALMLAGGVSEPLRELTLALNRVARGDYSQRVEPTTNDELGALTDGFNRMTAGLAEWESIRAAFGRYVDSEVATQILEEGVNTEGEMKDVTVMFADLRGFTSYAESHHPAQVLGKLNGYFSAMSRAIGLNDGVILQYVGDEIYAVFGAPKPDPLHADKAYRAALEMRRALAELNAAWRAEDGDEFEHGIGLHSGLALAGNVGSATRMTYNLVGDTVNTASRVADLTKKYGWDLLLTQETIRRFSRTRDLETLETVQVKGRREAITIYKG